MFCPDCQQNLDNVPPGDPCPECGGARRSAVVHLEAAAVAVTAVAGTVNVGYNLKPGWTNQWRSIQRHLSRLRECYQGIDTKGNDDAEETVHALFIGLYHLSDWLIKDDDVALGKSAVKRWIGQHMESLGLCRDYANTRKHMTRTYPGERIAQITSFAASPSGYAFIIGYRAWDDPEDPMTEVDALALAEASEQAWRDLLAARNVSVPA